jgi:hypothetical protein
MRFEKTREAKEAEDARDAGEAKDVARTVKLKALKKPMEWQSQGASRRRSP